ncbi:FecR family protein [Mucilaginibacter galii]|uniref:Anti-sigma factor n=1 Tax=Mucilaginibacter galii TaxID=2005073 RepID=A0A917JDJ2_9SPHI|nr:FecR domain-containing protein [Mucilaginibacter galii]GGI51749.1 anti-sigma factor [Mucilaginibacter galii]
MDENLFTLLKKYLSGNVSVDDRSQINDWYDNLDKAEAGFKTPFERRRAKDDLWAHIQAGTERPTGKPALIRYWSAAAAVILIATASLLYVINRPGSRSGQINYLSVTVPAGQTREVVLNDGSHVWLNSGSSFKYPSKFSDTSRLVQLIRGEAFFKVAKDPGRPFRIASEKINTSVVGTSFNIRTLRSSGLYQIRVMTGKVKITSGHTLLATLTKNTGLNAGLYSGQKLSLTTHNEALPAWMSGNILLQSVSFNELADVIDQYYAVHIQSADPDVLDGSYSFTFSRKDKLESVLNIISSVNGMQYTRKGNQVTIK